MDRHNTWAYICAGVAILAAGVYIIKLFIKKRQGFSLEDHENMNSVCSSHCFSNSDGEISDVYDCCNCMAIISGHFEPSFHQCMCNSGYNDYCYKPVTNLLLSQ